MRRIRRHWPRTRLTFRGDSHYGRREAMDWCEDHGADDIFGLAGNAALHALAYETADDLKVHRAEAGIDRMRGFADPSRETLATDGHEIRYSPRWVADAQKSLGTAYRCDRPGGSIPPSAGCRHSSPLAERPPRRSRVSLQTERHP